MVVSCIFSGVLSEKGNKRRIPTDVIFSQFHLSLKFNRLRLWVTLVIPAAVTCYQGQFPVMQ